MSLKEQEGTVGKMIQVMILVKLSTEIHLVIEIHPTLIWNDMKAISFGNPLLTSETFLLSSLTMVWWMVSSHSSLHHLSPHVLHLQVSTIFSGSVASMKHHNAYSVHPEYPSRHHNLGAVPYLYQRPLNFFQEAMSFILPSCCAGCLSGITYAHLHSSR